MKIYIDGNYCCHADAIAGGREIDVPFFDGKCTAFIEAYRFVPNGESWARADGVVFQGEMLSVCGDLAAAKIKQEQYELDEAAHLEELGALIEEIYNEDVGMIDDM